ncbi:MAG: homoserine O-acetyltransferase [Bacteroidales bacterium]|jgi:homoserine O-acetyltransferase|nr:homoserine O-acetyltransferase [Bacteroidales bacterium]
MRLGLFRYNKPFKLESGESLPELEICYHISKEFREPGINRKETHKQTGTKKKVIWITHALTANSDPSEWWDTLVGEGKFFDPRKYTIVCANLLGSCYGSTGPASVNPKTGKPYLLSFPKVTVRDEVNFLELLRKHLGIKKIDLIIGGSVGGYQAVEWSIMYPDVIKNAAFIATSARVTPWETAFNESQRMILEADGTFGNEEYAQVQTKGKKKFVITGGLKGMGAARTVALISYRSCKGYNSTQQDLDINSLWKHRAISYQRHQGEKLEKRFNAYSYLAMVNLFDSQNVGRGRGGVEKALAKIKAKVLCIGIDSDILFPWQEQKFIAEHAGRSSESNNKTIGSGKFVKIKSDFGHDGFLLEYSQIQKALKNSFKDIF